jgi:hypothetical protein
MKSFQDVISNSLSVTNTKYCIYLNTIQKFKHSIEKDTSLHCEPVRLICVIHTKWQNVAIKQDNITVSLSLTACDLIFSSSKLSWISNKRPCTSPDTCLHSVRLKAIYSSIDNRVTNSYSANAEIKSD